MLFNIWIDDMRRPPTKDNLIWFKDAETAIEWFQKEEEICPNDVMVLYLDHDLGMNKTGYDFAKFFVEWNLDRNHSCYFHLLTANPVGAFNIRQLLTHYGYKEIK